MKTTKKITVSAMMVALSVAFMTFGYFFPTFDLTVAALSSLVVAMIYVEIGSPYTYLVWICTSIISFLFFSGSAMPTEYLLVFGIYPVLKGGIERLSRHLWLLLKLLYVNAVLVVIMLVMEKLLLIPFFTVGDVWMKVAVWGVINIAFLAYDLFITVLMRLYTVKYRRIFSRFFK